MRELKDVVKNLRLEAGFTLRAFAEKVGISAAYLSDIEHGRRMPSDEVLARIALNLRHVGATFEDLKSLDARIDAETARWLEANPEVGQLLREAARSSKRPAKEIIEKWRKIFDDKSANSGEDPGEAH